ncbi:MAG: threonine synthase [Oscillospiraceae bacterium]|nr:threonine synthase [Oscillospiraceae bacterium]
MVYKSTRSDNVSVSAAQAIAQGISKDGGLFVPQTTPKLSATDFENLRKLDYIGRAKYILRNFLDDFSDDDINYCVEGAYSGTFDNDLPAPLSKLADGKYILELWHGPTCAFKDLALQLLPYLLTTSANKVSNGKETVILVATSGDTGKAALEGFKDVENTKIIVFYPNNGVSPMQRLQMDTQLGENVFVCAIDGNFDDAQSGVKKIFADIDVAARLADSNMQFSSANSINWGRLVPQIVYYISAYCDLMESGADVEKGFNVVVPTGNFGNILAAYYAKIMGTPIAKLICASNSNNVLTDFINTGDYDRNREFYTTISPSMDILISSNLERMLYELSGKDAAMITDLQEQLAATGKYTVTSEISKKIKDLFWAESCDDEKTLETIRSYFEKYSYLIDTHTAVALAVYDDYIAKTGDTHPTIIASTASPYKFSSSVLEAIAPEKLSDGEFEKVKALHEVTNTEIPKPILELEKATVRFNNVCKKDNMIDAVLDYLKINTTLN